MPTEDELNWMCRLIHPDKPDAWDTLKPIQRERIVELTLKGKQNGLLMDIVHNLAFIEELMRNNRH